MVNIGPSDGALNSRPSIVLRTTHFKPYSLHGVEAIITGVL